VRHPLKRIADGGACTWFLTPANPVTARKKWIAGSLEPRGALVIDAGAVKALRSGKSLLPAGVVKVEGAFGRGDAVVVRGPDGAEIGRGLIAFDADDAERIKGRSSADIPAILGFSGRTEMIHRDDLALGTPAGLRRYPSDDATRDLKRPLKAIDRSPGNPGPPEAGVLCFRPLPIFPLAIKCLQVGQWPTPPDARRRAAGSVSGRGSSMV
jgi:hypothetical protein